MGYLSLGQRSRFCARAWDMRASQGWQTNAFRPSTEPSFTPSSITGRGKGEHEPEATKRVRHDGEEEETRHHSRATNYFIRFTFLGYNIIVLENYPTSAEQDCPRPTRQPSKAHNHRPNPLLFFTLGRIPSGLTTILLLLHLI